MADRRCSWALSTPEYERYHDDEWGRPVLDGHALFERLSLEAFQSGLSWLTILRKREAFRQAFSGFRIERVAEFGDDDVKRLLADAAIVRNRAKIQATIQNARAASELGGPGALSELLWSFRPPRRKAPRSMSDLPAQTGESQSLARELKSHGFRFVGPTTAYALMQACGLVNDHIAGCPARAEVERQRKALPSPR